MNAILVCGSLLLLAAGPDKFSEVEIEKPFDTYLQANPLLMEVTGAKIIRRKDGTQVVVAVASTVLKDKSADDRLRAEKVCRVKALASVVAEKKGVQVCHVEEVKEKTEIVIENGKETGKSISELLQVTKTKVEGIAKDMPVVGKWKSKDGSVFYLAIGTICDKKGEPIPQETKEKPKDAPKEKPKDEPITAHGLTIERVIAAPAKFEGKTFIFDNVQLSGKLAAGPARLRLSLKTPAGKTITDKGENKVLFVVSKDYGAEIARKMDEAKTYTVTLTCSVEKAAKGKNWLVVVTKVEFLGTDKK